MGGAGVVGVVRVAFAVACGVCVGCPPHDGTVAKASKTANMAQPRATGDTDTITGSTLARGQMS